MTTSPARLEDVAPYQPVRGRIRIDLSDNTNAWGAPPSARLGAPAPLSGYPTPYCDELKAAIANYVGAPAAGITTGCGSDAILDVAFRALARPGDRIAYCVPTFVMVRTFALLNGMTPVELPLGEHFTVDVDALLATNARIIYLCSPNNPTGRVVARESIERLVRETGTDQRIVIDEAYAEFAGVTSVDLAVASDRVVVTRTMSKAFGLAGLRVGYGIGSPGLISLIEKARGPYTVSTPSERIARRTLADDVEWMRGTVALARRNRERLAGALRARGIKVVSSDANFVFALLPAADAVAQRMLAGGIAVRSFADPSALRITVAPWPQLAEMLAALDEACR